MKLISKILFGISGLILFLLTCAVIVLYNPFVQTFIAKKISKTYSEILNADINISKVELKFYNSFVLEDIYISDTKLDSLIYAEKISLKIDSINLKKKQIYISQLILKNVYFKYEIYETGISNIKFLTEYFSSENKNTEQKTFVFNIKKAVIKNSSVEYFNNKKNKVPEENSSKINYNHIKITNLNSEILNITYGENTYFDVNKLTATEKSGFNLRNLKAKILIKPKEISVKDCKINTLFSDIYSKKMLFTFDSIEEFYNFPYSSNSSIDIDSAFISVNEFKHFSKGFPQTNSKFYLSGTANTTPKNIILNKFNLKISENSYIKTNAKIENFNENPEIYCNNILSEIDCEDYNNFSLNKIFSYNFILPNDLKILQKFTVKGKFNYSNSKSNFTGKILTEIGNFYPKITSVTYENKINIFAEIKTDKILTSEISKNNKFEYIKPEIYISAQIFKNEKINFKSDIYIHKLLYNNYLYSNIEINSSGTDSVYAFKINFNDSNLVSEINLTHKASGINSLSSVSVDLKYADIKKLNFDTTYNFSKLKGSIAAEIKGNSIDNFSVFLGGNDIIYNIENDSIVISNFFLIAHEYEKQRIINIESDYLNLDIRGVYKFNLLINSLENFAAKYIPSYKKIINSETDLPEKEQIINLTADFNNLEKINKYIFKDVNISDSTHIEAFYSSKDSYLDLQIFSPLITLKTNSIKNLDIKAFTDNNHLNFNLDCKFNTDKENPNFEHKLFYTGILSDDSLNSILSWKNSGKTVYGGNIALSTKFNFQQNSKKIVTTVSPTKITFADEVWNIDGQKIVYENNKIFFDQIQLFGNKKRILLNGIVGYENNDFISAEIYDFDIEKTAQIFLPDGFTAKGNFNGNILARNILTNPSYEIVCRIENFEINNLNFGDISITAEQDTVAKALKINSFAQNGDNRFSVEGNIFNSGEIDFYTTINKIDLQIIKPVLPQDFEIKKGYIYGNAQIFGTSDNINWLGTLGIKDTHVNYGFLNADFKFSTLIALSNNNIQIPKTEIFDSEQNSAFIDLTAQHHNFKNFDYTLNFSTTKFIFLNSKQMNTDGIYGKLYTSGDAEIFGNEKLVNINAAMSTLPQSELFVVTVDEEQTENSGYIYFGEKKHFSENTEKYEDFSNIALDFNLNITPQTNLKIILDQNTGDALSLNGEGLLNFKTDNAGQTNVSGEYIFNKGKYNFYVENIYGKEFTVENNSKIVWNGSPFDATIDITAEYNINKADIYDLTLDTQNKNEYVPVSCKIIISEKLMKPNIKFDVEINEPENSAAQMLNNLPADEINKQFLSLLILNSFQPLPGLTKPLNDRQEYDINVAEILAGQLGSLVSLLSEDFAVDVKYNQKTQTNSDEIEVDFSTGLLDDRILINGNIAKGEYRNTTSNIVGDFEAEIKLNQKGNIKMKVFNKSNRNVTIETEPYTQGIGFFYKSEFNKIFNKKRKQK